MVGGEPEHERNADIPDGERCGGERHETLPFVLAEVAGFERELRASQKQDDAEDRRRPRRWPSSPGMTALLGSGPSLLESVLKRRLSSQTLCVLPSAVSTVFGV